MTELSPNQKRESRPLRGFPLSFTQQRLWLLNEMEGGETIAYNIPIGLRLQGELEERVLERALGEVVRRHETLRTTFEMNGQSGAVEQVIHGWEGFKLRVVEVGGESEEEKEEEMRREAREESRGGFDLRKGPLMRGLLVREGAERHVLVITMHHIISDGWSMGLLIKELATFYEAYLQGNQQAPLPDLPIQYVDYANWQRKRMTSEVLERQLNYWRGQLQGPLPVLELPTRGVRPTVYSTRGRVRVWRMTKEMSEGVKEVSQGEGVTMFMSLLAAFKVLMYRYTGERDVVVGTPIAGRNRREVEGLIGCFINTLVMRTDLRGEPSFRELVARVKEVALGAYANQEVPFEKLVEELQPERDQSRSPLFQVMFVLQNAPMPAFKKGDLVMSPLVIEGVTSKFDITLSLMEEEGGGILGWLECNSDLFDEAMMQRLIGHYETLLRGIIADPDARISRLPLLTEAERRLLIDWNDTAGDYGPDLCMHELIEAQVKRTPQATAVIFESRRLTYEELNEQANQLARHLQARGIGPEMLVGISMERSLEMIIALLGVLKAGGAYVPLDPTYPRERLAFMMEDAEVKLVLTQQHLAEQLPDYGAPVICLDTDAESLARAQAGRPEDHQNLATGVSPRNLAYIIYTSGSTGRPKGVMTSHQAMCNMILWMQSAYGMTADDRLLQKTSFSFDASVWEFYWPLISGATLVVAKPYGDKDGAYMVKTAAEERVTILQMVPSVLQMVVGQEGFENCRSLRHMFSGGEVLSATVCEKFFERLPAARLTNVYGPTETAMHVTIWDCERGSQHRAVPIGRPLGNTRAYVLDEWMQPVPVDVAGELYIGGVQVARGYVNRPDLTAARFVPDPHGREPGGRLYRTGDKARYRADGGIEFLGRIDDQVKIRGYRIELGEIESVLRQHPGVMEVVVMAREDVPGDRRLAAYIVPRPAEELRVGELRNFVLAKLPDYMTPSAFVLLEKMPLMTNGKVDRHALPPPEHTRQELEQAYVAPRNEIEEKLAAIFSEVLNVEKVGVEDSFFLLGGHSLSATQVITRILAVLQVEIPLRCLFETPTVAGLARAVGQAQQAPEEDRIEVISRPGPEAAEPLAALLGQLSSDELQALLLEVAARKQK